MSEDTIPSFTAADGTEAATPAEGALTVHAVEGALNVHAGTQSCVGCASLTIDLGIANARYGRIQQALAKMENDTIVSTDWANQRE